MPTLKLEPPRYRVLADAFIGGTWYTKNSLIVYKGFPPPTLEPLNSTAAIIASDYLRRQAQPGYPRSPYHAVYGLYLPALLPRCAPPTPNAPPGSEILGLVPDKDSDPQLPPPKYKMRRAHRVGQRELAVGAELSFIGWPPDFMEPISPSANEVVSYLSEHRDNPKLLEGPWCCLHGLFLPDLPAKPPKAKTAQQQLDAIAFQRASAREVEIVTGGRAGAVTPIPSAPASGVSNSV